MDTLATIDELALHLIQSIPANDPHAQLELENATGLIQRETDQHLFKVTDDTVQLPGTWDRELWLPERPVTSVTSVKINTVTIALGGWVVSSGGQLYRGLLPVGNGPDWDDDLLDSDVNWGGPASVVEVTYTHGFDPIPPDLRALCLELAARAFANPSGLQSETIGNYGYTNRADAPSSGELSEEQRRICAGYRREAFTLPIRT